MLTYTDVLRQVVFRLFKNDLNRALDYLTRRDVRRGHSNKDIFPDTVLHELGYENMITVLVEQLSILEHNGVLDAADTMYRMQTDRTCGMDIVMRVVSNHYEGMYDPPCIRRTKTPFHNVDRALIVPGDWELTE